MKTRNIMAMVSFLWCVALLSGCALGGTQQYRDVVLNFKASGDKRLGLATHDEREYIVSGKKDPKFVGLLRGGYGNPFNVSTSTGKSFAEDVTTAIEKGLENRGFTVAPITVSAKDKTDEVLRKLVETTAERLILIRLIEWKSDTYINTDLIYNVAATIYDAQGKAVAEKTIQGNDNLGGSYWAAPSHAQKVVPPAFANKIEELLNSPGIQTALQ